jgi:putative Holliday junction resolvase
MPATNASVLALDVGDRRVGLAIASLAARLPRPMATLERGDGFWQSLDDIIKTEGVGELVVGRPRGLDGQATAQTVVTEDFVSELQAHFALPVHLQDEAVTSQQAEAELKNRRQPYNKADIDALAATYILEDYLHEREAA